MSTVPPDPTYIVCPVCGGDHFLLSRRMYTLPLVGGVQQRNWSAGENSSHEVVCDKCLTRLKWNNQTMQYDIVARFQVPEGA